METCNHSFMNYSYAVASHELAMFHISAQHAFVQVMDAGENSSRLLQSAANLIKGIHPFVDSGGLMIT